MTDSAIDQEVEPISEALLSQGYALLRYLELRQQAVELEAATFELRRALESAEQGKCDALRGMIEQHEQFGAASPLPTSMVQLPEPSISPNPAATMKPAATTKLAKSLSLANRLESEGALKSHADSKQQGPSSETRHATLPSAASVLPNATELPSLIETNQVDIDQVDQDRVETVQVASETLPDSSPWNQLLETLERAIEGQANAVEPQVESRTTGWSLPPASDHTLAKGRLRSVPSWVVSLVVHGIALLILGIITIQTLDDSKVFSIQASSAESETVVFEAIAEDQPQELEAEPIDSANPSPAFESLATLTTPSLSDNPQLAVEAIPASVRGSSTAEMLTSPKSSGARGASAQFFGAEAAGNTFCFVVDSSGSMRKDGAFDAAKRELLRSISALKPTQRFYIYFFSDKVESLRLGNREPEKFPVYATPENLRLAAAWIDGIKIRGGRAPNDAFDLAIEMEPDAIFLLFDGDTKVDVAAHLRKVNRVDDLLSGPVPRVSIHTIGFGDRRHETLMIRIAEENLGTYRFVPLVGSVMSR